MDMLVNLFTTVLNISVTATVISVILLIVKKIFSKKLNATWHYYIWFILIIRLMVPVFPQSSVSIFNLVKIPDSIYTKSHIENDNFNNYTFESNPLKIDSELRYLREDEIVNAKNNTSLFQENIIFQSDEILDISTINNRLHDSFNSQQNKTSLIIILSIIWFIGMSIFFIYTLICNIFLIREIQHSHIYNNDNILNHIYDCCKSLNISQKIKVVISHKFSSSCIYGCIRPTLIIPSTMLNNMSESIRYILLHELTHLKRKDGFISIILIILKAIYWFNPFVWYCFSKIRSDCEMSCDEGVLVRLDRKERLEYGKTILDASVYYSKNKLTYSTVGMANRKEETKRRILNVSTFKKPTFVWVSLAVLISLFLVVFVLTDGVWKDSQETIALSSDNSDSEDEEERIKSSFEKLYSLAQKGETAEYVAQDEYLYLISKEDKAIKFLKEQVDSVKGTKNRIEDYTPTEVRKKHLSESFLSDIFINRGSKSRYIGLEYGSIVVVNKDSTGRIGPGFNFDEWCKIPKNTIINLTGVANYSSRWYTAKKVLPLDDKDRYQFMNTDQVEFWINEDDIEFSLILDKRVKPFNPINLRDAAQYNHIIKSLDDKVKIYDSPYADNNFVGYANKNDLIRLKKNGEENPIKEGEWLFVENIPFLWDSTNIGWIKEEYVVELEQGMHAGQGFIYPNTKIYTSPDIESEKLNDIYPEIKELISITPIHIRDRKEGWFQVSAGVNSFVGWIHEDNVYYNIRDALNRHSSE